MADELILCYRIYTPTNQIGAWLSEAMDRIRLITSDETRDAYAPDFPNLESVPEYVTSPEVERRMDAICERGGTKAVIHVTEDDILRCARVRDRYGIPGLRLADALPWRDKYHMKQWMREAGVPTADFLVPADTRDALEFAERVGYPLVAKPRLGFASRGVELLSGPDEVQRAAADWDFDDLLLESYVEGGTMYHVDGFTDSAGVTYAQVSRYVNGCLSFAEALPLGSVQLGPGSPESVELTAYTERVVAALPDVGFCPFHLEVFRTPDGGLVFCEIACRLGGAHVVETLTLATGVNPLRLWLRHQAGLEDGRQTVLADQGRRYGWLFVPPKAGRLLSIREPEDTAFIRQYSIRTTAPRTFDGAHSSSDSIATFVVDGADSAEVEQNLRACVDLMGTLATWEDEREQALAGSSG
ncbi:ATP-grasp domain-containing protein [Streptomyces sp. NPDC007100]|uniref:ATP-grasp domain-containing protein n=1 Tax=Streptomyces sp. NPDC007100 TaxID=3155602 RepID=UPI0033EAF2B6